MCPGRRRWAGVRVETQQGALRRRERDVGELVCAQEGEGRVFAEEEGRGGGVDVVEEEEGDKVIPEGAEGPGGPVTESGGNGVEQEGVEDRTVCIRRYSLVVDGDVLCVMKARERPGSYQSSDVPEEGGDVFVGEGRGLLSSGYFLEPGMPPCAWRRCHWECWGGLWCCVSALDLPTWGLLR